jgi:hypothetical protein
VCFLQRIITAKLTMAGNPSWWSMHPPSQQPSALLSSSPSSYPSQYVLGSSPFPLNSLPDNQELPQSWSQLLLYLSLSLSLSLSRQFILLIRNMLHLIHRFILIFILLIIFHFCFTLSFLSPFFCCWIFVLSCPKSSKPFTYYMSFQ